MRTRLVFACSLCISPTGACSGNVASDSLPKADLPASLSRTSVRDLRLAVKLVHALGKTSYYVFVKKSDNSPRST